MDEYINVERDGEWWVRDLTIDEIVDGPMDEATSVIAARDLNLGAEARRLNDG